MAFFSSLRAQLCLHGQSVCYGVASSAKFPLKCFIPLSLLIKVQGQNLLALDSSKIEGSGPLMAMENTSLFVGPRMSHIHRTADTVWIESLGAA